jgi:hypothetical protein
VEPTTPQPSRNSAIKLKMLGRVNLAGGQPGWGKTPGRGQPDMGQPGKGQPDRVQPGRAQNRGEWST